MLPLFLIPLFVTAQRFQFVSVYKGEAEKVYMAKKSEAEAEAKYYAGLGIAKQHAKHVWYHRKGGDGDHGHSVLQHH